MRVIFIILILLLLPYGTHATELYAPDITAFVSPDSSYASVEEIVDSANSSIYLHFYTFENSYVARRIAAAALRGVEVILVVEESPAGGISDEEKAVLDMLGSVGAAPYYNTDEAIRYNHAKYMIVDNSSVLITTENLGYSGFPVDNSFGNRGWGVIVYGSGVAEYFLNLFFEDIKEAEAVENYGISPSYEIKKGKYAPKFKAQKYEGNFLVVPFTAPEEAIESIISFINSANDSLLIEQFYVYKYWGKRKYGSPETTPNAFLEAAIDAARKGVRVRILLDSTWYNVERDDPVSNYYTVQYINEIARDEALDMEARLADKRTGLEKLHVKGVVIDDKAVLISSVNWNEHSPTKNREIGLIVYGDVAHYFSRVFASDWEGGGKEDNRYLVLLAFALGVAIVIIKKVKTT